MDGKHGVDDVCGRHYDDAEPTAPDLRQASGLRGDHHMDFLFLSA